MARPSKHASAAERQKAYVGNKRIVRVTVPVRLAETLDRIAQKIDSRRATLAGAMVAYAIAHEGFETFDYNGALDARVDGPTTRIDVPMPEGVKLENWRVVEALQFAVVNRQWSRFGLR